jgi:hypothetical protein
MIRLSAIVAIVVCMSPPVLRAQGTVFTVGTPAADVHKSPSTGSPVIGTAPKGRSLTVTRELGSWVSVAWPGAQGEEAFVHVSAGSIAHRSPSGARNAPLERGAAEPSLVAMDVRRVEQAVLGYSVASRSPGQSSAPLPPSYVTPPHVLGVGALMGGRSPAGFGVSGRAWPHRALGVQMNLSRYAITSPLGPERLTSVQFEPSVLYSPRNYVSDYLWLRPYAGSGVSMRRDTLHSGLGAGGALPSTNRFGVQAFGGGEMTFAGLPQFALSADLGYRWVREDVPVFALDGMAFSIAGHWYVK